MTIEIKNNNICKCDDHPDQRWSDIKEKPLTAGSVSSSETKLLVYQVCNLCGFIRILAN